MRSSRPATRRSCRASARSPRTGSSARWWATRPPQASAASSSRSSRRTATGRRTRRPSRSSTRRRGRWWRSWTARTSPRCAPPRRLRSRPACSRGPTRASSRSSAPACSRARRRRCSPARASSPRCGSPGAASSRTPSAAPTSSTPRPPRRSRSSASSGSSPGTHVSSVGYEPGGGSELDPAIVEQADVVVVEQRDSAFAPLPAGAPELEPRGRDGVVELGEVIAGTAAGRSSDEQITLYKSVGVAVQDLAAAALVLAAARERGTGQEIELEEIHA